LLITIAAGIGSLLHTKEMEIKLQFSNAVLSLTFVLASCFFIAICGTIVYSNLGMSPGDQSLVELKITYLGAGKLTPTF